MSELAQFEQVVLALMSPENNVRNQAETAYNQAKANPDALITALTQLLRHNQQEQVTLRDGSNAHWSCAAACCRRLAHA